MEKIPPKSLEEKKNLVKALLGNNVFTDRHFRNEDEAKRLLPLVFMPVALGAFSMWPEEVLKDIGLIYQYMDKAGQRAINGYPMFMAFEVLNRADTLEVFKAYEEVAALTDMVGITGMTDPTKETPPPQEG